VITSPDLLRLASTSCEMFRTLRLTPTGRKFYQKLSCWVLRVITSPDATQLNSTKLFCWVESLKRSHRPTRFNSRKQFCWVELSRVGRYDQGFNYRIVNHDRYRGTILCYVKLMCYFITGSMAGFSRVNGFRRSSAKTWNFNPSPKSQFYIN